MQALLVSLAAVAIAEIGDKTQLLALILAARYRKPWPICLGIFVATLLNHALAGEAGVLLTRWLSPETLHWIIGLSFLAVAVWALFPDRIDEKEAQHATHHGVFAASPVRRWACSRQTCRLCFSARVSRTDCRCAQLALSPVCCSPCWA